VRVCVCVCMETHEERQPQNTAPNNSHRTDMHWMLELLCAGYWNIPVFHCCSCFFPTQCAVDCPSFNNFTGLERIARSHRSQSYVVGVAKW